MGKLMIWDFESELKKLIKTSLQSNNKESTILNKLNVFLNINKENLKHWEYKTIWPNHLENLERYERCFRFLKTGFFNTENHENLYSLSSVTSINSYVHLGYKMTINNVEHEISKQDYFDLKLILK